MGMKRHLQAGKPSPALNPPTKTLDDEEPWGTRLAGEHADAENGLGSPPTTELVQTLPK